MLSIRAFDKYYHADSADDVQCLMDDLEKHKENDEISFDELYEIAEQALDELYSAVLEPTPDQAINAMVESIYQLRRTGKDYQKELDDLIYHVIGRI
jgi:hypothetical protein